MKTFLSHSNGYDFVSLDSVTELVDACASASSVHPQNIEPWASTVENPRAWNAHYNIAKIRKFLRNPPDASIKVRDLVEKLEGKFYRPMKVRRRITRLEDGDELDPFAHAQRLTDGWSAIRHERKAKRVIRIAINTTVHSERKPEELWHRGAAFVALADAVEASGQSVELVLFNSQTGFYPDAYDRRKAVLMVTLKHPESPIDIDTLALVTAEIGFFRTCILGAEIAMGTRLVNPNVGTPASLPEDISEQFDLVLEQDILTEEGARQILNTYTKKFQP
jgi:hypothetical protein